MQLRVKFGFIGIGLLSSLILSTGMLYFLNLTYTRQAELSSKTQNVFNALYELQRDTDILVSSSDNHQDDFIVLQFKWRASVEVCQLQVSRIRAIGLGSVLTSEIKLIEAKNLLVNRWEALYGLYYLPAREQLKTLVSNGVTRMTDENSFLFRQVVDRMDREIGSLIQSQAKRSIELHNQFYTKSRRVRQVGGIFLLIVLLLAIFNRLWTNSIVSKIYLVGGAMKTMATGDFSYSLNIRSGGDEFEELSNDYNSLKDQLRVKLNSVLKFMLSISSSLREGPALGDVMQIISSAALENTDADGAAIYFIDSENELIEPKSISGYYPPPFPLLPEFQNSTDKALAYARTEPIPLGVHFVGSTIKAVKPVFLRSISTMGPENCDFFRTEDDPLCIESIIIVPLMIAQRVVGAIVITKRPSSGPFADLDFMHMQTFADYAALTVEHLYNTEELIEQRELYREVSIASEIQKGLLPRKLPSLNSAQIFAFSRAARGISGDYYDVFRIEAGRIGVVICDVIGKGVPASLHMVMIRTILRMLINPSRTPKNYLSILNKGLMGRGQVGAEQFATLTLFCYDEEKRTIVYSNAAHPPLLLYRSSEHSFTELDTQGLPIGVELKQSYEEKSMEVRTGDIIVLYTDGITEARSHEGMEYSSARFRNRIRRCADKSAREIVNAIKGDIDRFTTGTGQHDDQTLIVMKIE